MSSPFVSLKEEEVLMELDSEHDVLAAQSILNVKLDCQDARIIKYHEVTNLAIEATINAPCQGHVTPRTRLLGSQLLWSWIFRMKRTGTWTRK